MRHLLAVCVALLAMLGVVTGNLWLEVKSARQQVSDLRGEVTDLQDKLALATRPVVLQAPPQPPPVVTEAPVAPAAGVAPSLAVQPPAVRTVIVTNVAPERPLGLPTLTTPLVGSTEEERRSEALAQSDRTATARVASWNTTLALSADQLQELNTITMEELRRETEDSLRITSSAGPMDARAAARLKVDTVTRQYDTLQRIHERISPQLTAAQGTRMKTMFDAWHATNMARARAEELAVLSAGN